MQNYRVKSRLKARAIVPDPAGASPYTGPPAHSPSSCSSFVFLHLSEAEKSPASSQKGISLKKKNSRSRNISSSSSLLCLCKKEFCPPLLFLSLPPNICSCLKLPYNPVCPLKVKQCGIFSLKLLLIGLELFTVQPQMQFLHFFLLNLESNTDSGAPSNYFLYSAVH